MTSCMQDSKRFGSSCCLYRTAMFHTANVPSFDDVTMRVPSTENATLNTCTLDMVDHRASSRAATCGAATTTTGMWFVHGVEQLRARHKKHVDESWAHSWRSSRTKAFRRHWEKCTPSHRHT